MHSLPAPDQVLDADSRRTRQGRWKMLLVMLVCAAPVVASYFTYYVIRPEGRRNFGELIDSQKSLPDLTALSLNGENINLQALKGQWLLVSVAGAACDERCERHLYLQRQLREGLGKEKDKVDWVWLISDEAPLAPKLQPALTNATVLRVPLAQLAKWLEPASGHELPEHLYLVDPLGNWMMRFPPNLDTQGAAKVKRDLERLLRAANSWDEPGR